MYRGIPTSVGRFWTSDPLLQTSKIKLNFRCFFLLIFLYYLTIADWFVDI
jgi:hypothetical protein